MKKKKIMFVCTGNTCRSVMAEALARDLVENMNKRNVEIEVASAGITALPGMPPSDKALKVLEAMGLDISYKKSSMLEKEHVCSADLVLTMTGEHCRRVKEMAPECSGKVFSLAEYAGLGNDVPDPFGATEDTYKLCASEISIMTKKALERFLSDIDEEPPGTAPPSTGE